MRKKEAEQASSTGEDILDNAEKLSIDKQEAIIITKVESQEVDLDEPTPESTDGELDEDLASTENLPDEEAG